MKKFKPLRLVAKGYNKKAVFIPSRSTEYHKAQNISSISIQAKNLSNRREVFLFEWSPQRRTAHQETNRRIHSCSQAKEEIL